MSVVVERLSTFSGAGQVARLRVGQICAILRPDERVRARSRYCQLIVFSIICCTKMSIGVSWPHRRATLAWRVELVGSATLPRRLSA